MRLHTLTLTGFGSFGGTEHVDFDHLAESGLFLLHGPTGAGKTTILDAVSFALFGVVPGARREGEGLRSHHAQAGVLTEVSLQVTFGAHRYRIHRQPRQQVPKQRGKGLTEKPAKVSVEELVDGQWVTRATRAAEAEHLLAAHLPMDADQFHQVVMLPQGDFARFLRATAEERRVLLEKLFATHRFADVERWLKEQSDLASRAVGDTEQHLRATLAAIAAVAGVEVPDHNLPAVEIGRWANDLVRVTTRRVRDEAELEAQAQAHHREAKAALDAAQHTAGLQRRQARAAADLARLNEELPRHQERIAQFDRAARAAEVAPLLGLVDEATAQVQRLQRLVGTVDPDGLGPRLERLVADIDRCSGLLDDEAQLTTQHRALDDIDQVLTLVHTQRTAIVEAAEVAGSHAAHHDLVQALTRRHAAAVQRDRLQAQLDGHEAELQATERAALEAHQQWLGLYQAQLEQRAALLADGLTPGDACPVCGSDEHPHLARPQAGQPLVLDEHLEAAAVVRDRADVAVEQLRTSVQAVRHELAAAGAIALDHPAADLRAELRAAQQLLEVAAEAATTLTALVPDHLDAPAYVVALDDELAAAQAERGRLHAELASRQDRVEAALDGFASLADRVAQLTADKASVEVAMANVAALDRARHEVRIRTEAASAAAQDRQFASLDLVRAAVLDPAGRDRLQTVINEYHAGLAALQSQLADPELLAATDQPPADLDAVAATAARAERSWTDQLSAADEARRVTAQVSRRCESLQVELDALQPLLDDLQVKRSLALLACGDDRSVANRMRLSTYVLAARLELVAAAASERLVRMSNGRFTIQHTDEARGNQKAGLGLEIVDAWTGTVRDTASLSGGESFFASLALALGVADVVTAETGGSRIDTLFIDEGFGSLDDQTLHDVMDVLDDLRSGGRAVGIVSHVPDLRTRISTQVEVVKTSTGSSIRAQVPATSTSSTTLAVA